VVAYKTPTTLLQDDRMSEDLPFGSRGGLAIRHTFPVNGEYVLKIRLQRTYTELIRGMSKPHELDLRLDRQLLKEFTVGRPVNTSPAAMGQGPDYDHMGDEGLQIRLPVKRGRG